MPETNFVNAATQIDAMTEKKEQVLSKVGGYVASAILSKHGNLSDRSKKDILNLIKDYPAEDQVEILTIALIMVARNDGGTSSHSSGGRRDIFSSWD